VLGELTEVLNYFNNMTVFSVSFRRMSCEMQCCFCLRTNKICQMPWQSVKWQIN